MGVSQQQISLWEKGRRVPRDDKRPRLARILGVDVAELFPYDADDAKGGAAA